MDITIDSNLSFQSHVKNLCKDPCNSSSCFLYEYKAKKNDNESFL